MMEAHVADIISPQKSRVVSAGGRPSARIEEKIAANCDVIAIAGDVETEIEQLLRAEGRELRYCQKLEHELCESTCRTRAIHDRLVVIRSDRRRANHALCNGEVPA